MSDELKPESAETLETSPVKETTPEEETKVEPTEEEVEWSSLKGGTQERIREILKERNELRQKVTTQAQEDLHKVETPTREVATDDEVQAALNKLKEHGVVTKDELEKAIGDITARQETNRIHDNLEKEFDGKDGKPKYVREEVEDYARKNNIWNLRAAYRDMYFDELADARQVNNKKRTVTEKPSSPTRSEPETLATLRAKLRGPNARAEYEKLAKNPQALDELLQQLAEE